MNAKTRNKARFLSISPSRKSNISLEDERNPATKFLQLERSSSLRVADDIDPAMPPLILLGKTADRFTGVITKETNQQISDKRISNALEVQKFMQDKNKHWTSKKMLDMIENNLQYGSKTELSN
jgi:hypothetical protein